MCGCRNLHKGFHDSVTNMWIVETLCRILGVKFFFVMVCVSCRVCVGGVFRRFGCPSSHFGVEIVLLPVEQFPESC